ncbi:hypothetical protein [Lacrimispora sp.]|uniref:hypothetical protein n=1 Tax=Lacrimispora sp. TaxID=2719234 RepID=UPI00289E259D|nr:hypothetical protein [Lacrimispora sp.]
MKFPYMVNHNGTYYKAGEEVPVGLPEMKDDAPEGALETHTDGSVNAYDENGNFTGTVDAESADKAIQKAVEVAEDKPRRGRPAKG